MMRLHSIVLSALLTSTIFASQGELASNSINYYDKYSLEDLMNISIVSSTGTPKKLSEAPSIATVITAEQIERSSARTLSEVLAMVPGLNVYQGKEFQKTAYDIRGIVSGFNSQILTLINGVPIDKFESGTTPMGFTFPASVIKRVEVIRGPGSAVYGADAFAGVINIITKDAEYLQNHFQSGVRYGSFDTAEVYGNYGELYESGLELGLNLSYMTSKGDKSRVVESDLQTFFDANPALGSSASLAPSAMVTKYDVFNMNLNLNYENFSMNLWTYLQRNNGTGAGATNALDNRGYIDANYIIGDFNHLSYSSNDLKWNNKLILSHLDQETFLVLFPAGATLPIGDDGNFFTSGGGLVTFSDGAIGTPDVTEEKIAFESTLNISKFENQNIRLSLGYSYVQLSVKETLNFGPSVINGTEGTVDGTLTDITGTPYIFLPDEDRKIFFVSLQDEYTFNEDWHLTAGVRYDNYSDFGDTINPRLGLVWNTSEKLTTKLLYGRAFRAPSAGELYYKNNPAISGNENLDPETIDMIELGTRYTPNTKLTSSLNLYLYEAKDLIALVTSTVGTIQSTNIGQQHGAGVELETSYQATEKLLLSADYAYRWTENDITKQAVANVPKHIAHASFDYSITQKWFLNSEVFYTADTPREVGDTRAKIDDYAVVNFSTGYRITDGLESIVAVRNLLDKKYVNPSNANPVNDYPMEGFNIFAELKYRF